ncbi:LytR/AlgR family response regulator transcription factor [Portibacter lacus]|uniref:DNA-binding response regulator n=1 Tax=Portibacter lacus TaxID=1099794 RepID=A0AA37SLC7_9BACT|nr:LytTR family DNA-binding domain-containing protein [Portibacter lacus]GLR16112.1 DNA-binding response regulator [Portibacter lacus]
MKVVLIEDEPLAAEKLERYFDKCSIDITLLVKLTSIKESITWIMDHHDEVDLFFMDIQLADGLSFEIFSKVNVTKPVIFTTAFDEYAIDAFKVNSIDYLLKPISFTSLSKALIKYDNLKSQYTQPISRPVLTQIKQKGYKQRFLVKKGNHIQSILTNEIHYFYAEGRDVLLVHQSGRKFLIEYTIEEIEGFVDASRFKRINRGFIVNISSISDVIVHSNRRLKLSLDPEFSDEVVVSRERVSDFKNWFGGAH